MNDTLAGYEELEHTADWALRVWAQDVPALFALAARGMYALMETTFEPGERMERTIELEGVDNESLLVAFLSELLYLGESEGLGFDRCVVELQEDHLQAQLWGAPIREQKKEIKAVTYFNLQVQCVPDRCEVTIVFDV